MSELIKILSGIPGFKKWFAILVFMIILGEGVALQVMPFVNRELTSLIEMSIQGEEVPFSALHMPVLASILAIVFYIAFSRIGYSLTGVLRILVEKSMVLQGFQKLLYHDIEYLTADRSGGHLTKVTRASNAVSQLLTSSLQALMRNLTRTIVSLVIITAVYWPLTVILLGIFVCYMGIYWFRFKVDIPLAKQEDDTYDKDFARIWEVIPQVKVTKIFGNEVRETTWVAKLYDSLYGIRWKRETLWNYAAAGELLVVQIPTVLVRIWIGYMAIIGVISLPNFILLFILIDQALQPMYVLNWFIWEIQNALDRSKGYLKIVNSQPKVIDPVKPVIMADPYGDIMFNKVSFKYKKSKDLVLNEMNITFPGKKISALVGKSGVGKSTITGLVSRFFDPVSGRITIGDTDIKAVTQHELREHIGIVLQDSFVFSGTIAENLRYAKEHATSTEIIEALKKAHAWEFVSTFKKGIQTEIGERGVKLSGGQRQRIAIARTILKDAPILILDEATNALDSESEQYVQQALDEFMHNRTVIIVAHRLSTLRNADMIYVLDENGVAEKGSHTELLKINGTYKMLYDIQAGGFSEAAEIMKEYEMR